MSRYRQSDTRVCRIMNTATTMAPWHHGIQFKTNCHFLSQLDYCTFDELRLLDSAGHYTSALPCHGLALSTSRVIMKRRWYFTHLMNDR